MSEIKKSPLVTNADGEGDGSLTVICEPETFPCSHDAFWLIVNALAIAGSSGYKRLQFLFKDFDGYKELRTGLGDPVFVNGPIKDFLQMFNVPIVSSCTGHFIKNVPYNMSCCVQLFRKLNMFPPTYFPSEEAVIWARQYVDAITITIRMTRHQPARNSNIGDWLEFAYCLKRGGHRVIFVPDTRYPDMPFMDFETCPQAAKNTHYRAALYRVCRQNFAVVNGPIATLCWATFDVPYVCFETKAAIKQFDEEHNNFNSLDFFGSTQDADELNSRKMWLGFEKSEQIPWSNPSNQRIVWDDDTLENILQTVDAMYPKSFQRL